MNRNFTVFNELSGEILGWYSCDETMIDAQIAHGQGHIEGHFEMDSNYILGVVTSRPVLNIAHSTPEIQANGVDICTITGIPAGAEVTDNGTTMTADGNPLEFVTDIPGEHKLKITLWPYQDAEVVINAI